MNRLIRVSVLALASASLPVSAFAAEVQPDQNLVEIIVTAQKRAEKLKDVPIAIVAVSGESLESNSIRTLGELSQSVPNVHVGQAFAQGYLSIRGLASGINPGFESTVGQVIDGYFYPRDRFAYLSFLDVERVEILKGPQGALIGKNTTAGAINITTARPTAHLAGSASVERTLTGDKGWTYQAWLSGPIADSFRARLVGRYEDHDGYMERAFTGDKASTRKDKYARLTLDWDASADLAFTLRAGRAEQSNHGRNIELIHCDAPFQAQLAALGLTQYEDCKPNWRTGENYARPALGPGQYDLQKNAANILNLTSSLKTGIGTLTSLTGYAEFDFTGQESGLRTAIAIRAVDLGEKWSQKSEELRLVSDRGERFDYIAGLYFLHSHQDTLSGISIFGPPPGFSSNIYSTIISKTYSAFGNFVWHVSSTLDATIEGRYTREDKEANPRQYTARLFVPTAITATNYFLNLSRSEHNFSPGFKLSWRPTTDLLVYGSYSRGFKGGGYNTFLNATSNATALPQAEFGPENTSAFEAGTKLSFANGRGLFTVAAFHQRTNDLQVTSLIPIGPLAAFSVQNAAEATTQGLESELTWHPIDGLTLGLRAGFIDAKYDKFPVSQCWRGQTAAQGCVNGGQSLTGADLAFAPRFSGSVAAEYARPVTPSWTLTLYGQVVHSGSFQTEFSNDPLAVLPSYEKYNARITLASTRLDFSLVGLNLSNTVTYIGANSTNSSSGGTLAATIDPPREYMAQFRYHF